MPAKVVQFPVARAAVVQHCASLGCLQEGTVAVDFVEFPAYQGAESNGTKYFCPEHSPLEVIATMPEMIAQFGDKPLGFDDLDAAFNMRDWLRKALESAGGKITGSGMGCGQGDLDVKLEGHDYNVSIRPIKRES